MNKLKKEIKYDFFRILYPTIMLTILADVILNYVGIYSWNIIGKFGDSILTYNFVKVKNDLLLLIIIVFISIIIIPSLQAIKNITMFKQCLVHDRIVINKFLDKNLLDAHKFELGEITHRLESDINNYRSTAISLFTRPFIIVLSFIFISFFIFNKSFYYGIICFICSTIPIIVSLVTKNIKAKYIRENQEYNDYRWTYEIDLIDNFKFIKMNNLIINFISRITNLFCKYYKDTAKKSIKCDATVALINSISSYGAKVIIILVGAVLVSKKQITPGVIASYIGYLSITQDMINKIAAFIQERANYLQYVDRLLGLYKDAEISGDEHLYKIENIEMSKLYFSYDKINYVIKNKNLKIDSKSRTCIIGKNGTGKSTLLYLISSLYPKYEGEININGLGIYGYTLPSIRDRISFIEQESLIFEGTIRENIVMDDNNISDKSILNLLSELDFGKSLDYYVYKDGSNLSGGEKQKLSLARGLIKEFDIILLDEPTNNLDKKTRKNVENILSLKSGVIFVTHNRDLAKIANMTIDLS